PGEGCRQGDQRGGGAAVVHHHGRRRGGRRRRQRDDDAPHAGQGDGRRLPQLRLHGGGGEGGRGRHAGGAAGDAAGCAAARDRRGYGGDRPDGVHRPAVPARRGVGRVLLRLPEERDHRRVPHRLRGAGDAGAHRGAAGDGRAAAAGRLVDGAGEAQRGAGRQGGRGAVR